jgi:hypothetical protein
MSADPVLEEFPIEAMEEIDAVAKEWIQTQSDKEVVNIAFRLPKCQNKKSTIIERKVELTRNTLFSFRNVFVMSVLVFCLSK